ncbi:MAG TPA: MFS transporter [Solirubrobacteraceae bacterium]|nr:MFS transporter [Solirubrobacteraceae bacterium]
MRSPLQSARLRRILAAYTANRLGTWFGVVALMVAVYDHTHSALAVAGLLLAWQALPAFVVPAVVARVEASSRRYELSGLYFFEALATAALAVLLWHFWLPLVLLIAALDGTAALTASALLRAALARAAREQVAADEALNGHTPAGDAAGGRPGEDDRDERAHEAERAANAASNVAFATTFVIGPAIAGAIVAAAGAPAALFIDVGSFLACGALLLDLHPHVEEAGGESVRARLRAAVAHLSEVPTLRWLLAVEAFALVFFESGAPIEITYAKVTLHSGDRGFGLLLTAWGAGAVLGSLVFARMARRSLAAMLSAGTLAVGLGYVGFAAAPSLALACVAALVGGVGNGIELPSLNSLIQRLTPQRLHGRMMGGVESLGALSLALGVPLGGALVAVSSPRVAFLAIGLGTALTAAALARTLYGTGGLTAASEPQAAQDREQQAAHAQVAPQAPGPSGVPNAATQREPASK